MNEGAADPDGRFYPATSRGRDRCSGRRLE